MHLSFVNETQYTPDCPLFPQGNLNVVEQAFALVVARSGLEIGSNLNWTELNTVFRFKVQASLEPALPSPPSRVPTLNLKVPQ
jgi:hypothetical protein